MRKLLLMILVLMLFTSANAFVGSYENKEMYGAFYLNLVVFPIQIENTCSDGIDNDGDTYIDELDSGCAPYESPYILDFDGLMSGGYFDCYGDFESISGSCTITACCDFVEDFYTEQVECSDSFISFLGVGVNVPECPAKWMPYTLCELHGDSYKALCCPDYDMNGVCDTANPDSPRLCPENDYVKPNYSPCVFGEDNGYCYDGLCKKFTWFSYPLRFLFAIKNSISVN